MSERTFDGQDLAHQSCPQPSFRPADCVTLGHGEGGRLTRRLIRERILPRLGNLYLVELGDAAALPAPNGTLAFTTDSYVVTPLFFPGGDIGTLAVHGTINDLAAAGARPLWLSLSLIIEEGLPFETLDRVLASVASAAQDARVLVVTGDTKVVPRGAADGLFLNVAGVGERLDPAPPGPSALRPGDEILVTGPIARHGVAVLAAREGLAFDPPPRSDTAPLFRAVEALHTAEVPVRAMRDATRGGLAAVLHEWAEASGQTLAIDEGRLPVTPEVRGVCELLGLDPVHIACEGVMAVAVPARWSDAALAALQRVSQAAAAIRVGEVRPRAAAPVLISRGLGREQALDEPVAAALPRIC
jgi:hydrogenase expression/formation protein HypE